MIVSLIASISSLLSGVTEIASPGIPGPLVVFGEKAEVVIAAKQGQFLEPVVARAEFGCGRVVAFGHNGYFGNGAFAEGQTRQLMKNAIAWARQGSGPVGVHRAPDMVSLIRSEGIEVRNLTEADLSNLDGLSLIVIDPTNGAVTHAAPIQRFVENGGGLIIASLGWGWLQLNPGKNLRDHPGNIITEKMGIVWADGYLERNAGSGFLAMPGPATAHAAKAIESLANQAADGQTGQTLTRAIATLPTDHEIIERLEKAMIALPEVVPSEHKPVRPQDVSARVALSLQLRRIQEAGPREVRAHPASAAFPGMPETESLPASKTLRIDTSRSRWHSTGLYALPGSVISVRTTSVVVESKLRFRIGAHSDSLWHLNDWKRAPEITLSVPITNTQFEIASAFGGLIYIEVPHNSRPGTVEFRIDGGIPAPHYVHGKTTLEEWKSSIRNNPAPWAELESSKVILTVPSHFIRNLDDPRSLMDFWDRVADACADLATISRERSSAERFVTDIQISAGYMHAGYPIMTHLDAAPRFVDLAFLTDKEKGGDWGMFHEIGHNHQHPDWTFGGTGEVTVNLFTLYIIETVVGRVPGYHVRWTDQQLLETFRKHREQGASFDKWKSDPFLALAMYVQLQQAFGWDAYKRVFAEYRDLPQSQRPRSDDEKRDQWMVRFSRAVGKNLGPFFDAWGVPVSAAAKESIQDLPAWDFPR
jgi:hypothetical protein